MAAGLAVAGLAVGAPAAHAQGTQAISTSANGWMQQVYVTVLGGYAPTGAQLYYFLDPFDPVTGAFAPGANVAIGPQFVRSGNTPFVAASNSTSLGVFAPATQLVFGVLMPDNTWRYTGAFATQGAVANTVPRNAVFLTQTPQITGQNVSSATYGWELNDRPHQDYNDLMFRVSQSTVTPEPASMTLIGLGLAGVGGILRRRRRKDAEG
jgi:hypothetical protein